MNFIIIINIGSTVLFLVTIILVMYLIKIKSIFWHAGLFFILSVTAMLLVAVSNIVEHAGITDVLDFYEEYIEILTIPFFLLFIYSLSSYNLLQQSKQNEQYLSKTLHERDILIKEIHHRVKNNLQIVSSLLEMQLTATDDNLSIQYIRETNNRVQTMGILHKQLYMNENIAYLNLGDYLHLIVENVRELFLPALGHIKIEESYDDIIINPDIASPCGILVNEILTNSYKYAFPGQTEGTIGLTLYQISDDTLKLDIYDTGIGLPDAIDFKTNAGLGLQLIDLLTKQMNATVTINRNKGTRYSIIIHTPLK